jgi:hypothetical protein
LSTGTSQKNVGKFNAKLALNVSVLFLCVILGCTWIYLAQNDVERHLFEEQRLALDLEEEFDPYYLKTDASKLIRIDSINKLEETRKSLIEFIWGSEELPMSMPTEIQTNHKDSRYEDIVNLSRIDLITIEMAYGFISKAYHFIPEVSNGEVILYHQGHSGGFILGRDVIKELVNKGYNVVGFSMPLIGMNNQPNIFLERFGWFNFENYIELGLLLPKSGHPLKLFIEPVIQVINYLENQTNYLGFAMVGISGGGWTTTVAAAIDTRITASFSVAGGVPMYLRTRNDNDWGSWEETVPEFYNIANYLELYILGSVGPDRVQWQIFNLYDPCCYSGNKSKTFGKTVSTWVERFGGGRFNFYIDDTHYEHKISSHAMELIEKELLEKAQTTMQ